MRVKVYSMYLYSADACVCASLWCYTSVELPQMAVRRCTMLTDENALTGHTQTHRFLPSCDTSASQKENVSQNAPCALFS